MAQPRTADCQRWLYPDGLDFSACTFCWGWGPINGGRPWQDLSPQNIWTCPVSSLRTLTPEVERTFPKPSATIGVLGPSNNFCRRMHCTCQLPLVNSIPAQLLVGLALNKEDSAAFITLVCHARYQTVDPGSMRDDRRPVVVSFKLLFRRLPPPDPNDFGRLNSNDILNDSYPQLLLPRPRPRRSPSQQVLEATFNKRKLLAHT